ALAEQSAGEDAGRGVDRDLVEAAVDGQGDERIEAFRVEVDLRYPAHGHAADLHRRVGPQLADLGEARDQLVAVAGEAEAAVGGRDRQHQQRRERQHQEGADGEFKTGATGCHWGSPRRRGARRTARCGRGVDAAHAVHRNRKAESTKLNISTSSEALTTARVVATEVPSMVGSAW